VQLKDEGVSPQSHDFLFELEHADSNQSSVTRSLRRDDTIDSGRFNDDLPHIRTNRVTVEPNVNVEDRSEMETTERVRGLCYDCSFDLSF
jgi:hypothetical protein